MTQVAVRRDPQFKVGSGSSVGPSPRRHRAPRNAALALGFGAAPRAVRGARLTPAGRPRGRRRAEPCAQPLVGVLHGQGSMRTLRA